MMKRIFDWTENWKRQRRSTFLVLFCSIIFFAVTTTLLHYAMSHGGSHGTHGKHGILERAKAKKAEAEQERQAEIVFQQILAQSKTSYEALHMEQFEDGPTRTDTDYFDFEKASPMHLEDADTGGTATATDPYLKKAESTNKKRDESSSVSAHFITSRKTTSDRRGVDPVSLPNFAYDYSEYAVGGVLERESDSFSLHVATFLVCHAVWKPKGKGLTQKGGLKVLKGSEGRWKQAFSRMESTRYHSNGMRVQEDEESKYYCRITHNDEGGRDSSESKSYRAEGHFVPNMLTIDSNSNKRLDIFRCKLDGGEALYSTLARHPTARLLVEILRGDEEVVLAYHIPWASRMVGLAVSHPPSLAAVGSTGSGVGAGAHSDSWHYETERNKEWFDKPWGTVDPWKGYARDSPGLWTHDTAYLCLAGVESPPSKRALPLLLEFLAHHLLLRVDHIFMAASFSWASPHMLTLKRVLQPYIDAARVSLASSCADGIDMAVSTSGLLWGRDNVKTFQTNLCSYYAKGMADYVLVMDIDEHLILPSSGGKDADAGSGVASIPELLARLMPPQKDIMAPQRNSYYLPLEQALLQRAERWGVSAEDRAALRFNTSVLLLLHAEWPGLRDELREKQGMKGLADGNAHPLCYLALKSAVTFFHTPFASASSSAPFMGQRFQHGHEPFGAGHGLGFTKTIRPTRTVYSGSLHVGGACRLPPPFNGCGRDLQHSSNLQSKKAGGIGEEPGFCFNPARGNHGRTVIEAKNGAIKSEFSARQYFDEVTIADNDAHTIDPALAYLSHIQYHRFWYGATPGAKAVKGDYAKQYFPRVFAEVDRMGMALPILLPNVPEPDPDARQADGRGHVTSVDHQAFLAHSCPRAPHNSSSLPTWATLRAETEKEQGREGQGLLLNVCVPDVKKEPSQGNVAEVLEFVQHYVLLGVHHLFLCVHFDWDSINMRRYQGILDSYIHEGRLTLHSCAEGVSLATTAAHAPHIDLSPPSSSEAEGQSHPDRSLAWKVKYASVCEHLSMGEREAKPWRADYLAVLSLDQFLTSPLFHGGARERGKGYADTGVYGAGIPLQRLLHGVSREIGAGGGGHTCAIAVSSAVVPSARPSFSFTPDGPQRQWWIGHQFNRSAVAPESRLHQLYSSDPPLILPVPVQGTARTGARPWTRAVGAVPGQGLSCAKEWRDSNTAATATAHIGAETPVALRFMTGRLYHTDEHHGEGLSPGRLRLGKRQAGHVDGSSGSGTNPYSLEYFPEVYHALRRRLLDPLVELVDMEPVVDHSAPDGSFEGLQWLDYDAVYAQAVPQA